MCNFKFILIILGWFQFHSHSSSDEDWGTQALNKGNHTDEVNKYHYDDEDGDSDIEGYYADYLDDDAVCIQS